MEWITDPQAWVAFATLTVLEVVLGIDNVVFISILAGKLPREQQARARRLGLGLAMLMRIALLFSLTWIIRLTAPLFEVLGEEISGRDLVSVLIQIVLLDIVFSLDSVITAVGMVDELAVMIAAVVVAVGFMMLFARPISEFVDRHPTVKMLALSFLLLIGVALIGEGLDQHIPKGYIYFAMAFSVGVELLNLRVRRGASPSVRLRQPYAAETAA
jgi:predicted tellurium resistance membrane protein TerC